MNQFVTLVVPAHVSLHTLRRFLEGTGAWSWTPSHRGSKMVNVPNGSQVKHLLVWVPGVKVVD